MAGGRHVSEQRGAVVLVVDDGVDAAVVVEIAERRAARRLDDGEAAAGRGRDLVEPRPVSIAEQQRALRPRHPPIVAIHLRIHVPVGHEQVQPAVVVVVEEPGAPPEKRQRRRAQAEPPGHVLETAIAEVAAQRVGIVREVGDERVHAAVVVVVAQRQPHPRLFAPFLVQREPGREAGFLERALARVPIQIVRRGVVDDEQIEIAVIVHVDPAAPEPVVAGGIAHSGARGHIDEPGAFVAEQPIRRTRQAAGAAHHPLASIEARRGGRRRTLRIDVHVTRHEQVEPAVRVVVAEARAG